MTHTPIWAALAATAVLRLRKDYTAPDDVLDWEDNPPDVAIGAGADVKPDPVCTRKMSDRTAAAPGFAPAPCSDGMETVQNDQRTGEDGGADGLAADSLERARPAVRIPHARLLLLLRLCATIETAAALADMLEPGAVTVIELGDADPVKTRDLLEVALVPEQVTVAQHWPVRDEDGELFLCAALLKATDEPLARQRMLDQLTSALEQPHPVVVLAASLADLPADVLRILPASRRLVPLSRDILLAHLCASHTGTGKLDAGLREKLPKDPELARLSWPTLAVALRAPCANGVATRLQSLTQVLTTAGPTLADIEGYGAAEAAARRMVADLQGWSEGRIAWGDVQRSILFYGAPGTGKSHLALAMSNSAGVALVRGSFAKWQSQGHLGDMLKAMRASFAEAAQKRPAILVIDEIDAVGDRAGADQHHARYQLQVVNGFLEEMDSLKSLEGVLVVGTCNYPEKIDAAVLRPGRFDVKVEVPLPGPQALARMLRNGFPEGLSKSDLAGLTRAAAGQTAADVDGALRQARSTARAESRIPTVADVLEALSPDPEDENPARDYRIALHECGHAIVATSLAVGQIRRLTFAGAGGQAWIRFANCEGLLEDWDAELAYHLAGRAAERLILGAVTAGSGGAAQSDLARATQIAVRIDTQFGLGVEGVSWQDLPISTYLRPPKNAARIRARLETAEARALQILKAERGLLLKMTAALSEHRMLEGDALAGWLAQVGKPTRSFVGAAGRVEAGPGLGPTLNASSGPVRN